MYMVIIVIKISRVLKLIQLYGLRKKQANKHREYVIIKAITIIILFIYLHQCNHTVETLCDCHCESRGLESHCVTEHKMAELLEPT